MPDSAGTAPVSDSCEVASGRGLAAGITVTTPCAVCAVRAHTKSSAFYAARGLHWPVTGVAGRTVHRACASEAAWLARQAAAGTVAVGPDGAGRWAASGQVIPGDSAVLLVGLGLAPALDLAATAAAHDAETAEVLARYRATHRDPAPAEELAEMRAAFGPGTRVINVITGRETQL
jgi:hypothetical protein